MTKRSPNQPDSSRTLSNERGASMVEYALLVILIAVVAFVAVETFGNDLSSTFGTIADSVAAAGN